MNLYEMPTPGRSRVMIGFKFIHTCLSLQTPQVMARLLGQDWPWIHQPLTKTGKTLSTHVVPNIQP